MRAFVLISGGLDSALVVKILKAQDIEVIGLNFTSPFSKPVKKELISSLDIKVKEVPLGIPYLKLLKAPQFGFGKNFNPCIDCHLFMLKKAKSLMKRFSVSFVATGEVLGQRSMSQHKNALKLIEGKSGLEGLLLRPLSAKLLDATIPENKGWVDRNKLFGISGRGRKEQLELVKEFKLQGFGQPAGGCLLTDQNFSNRLKDLKKHNELNFNNIELLKFGRYFRLSPILKLVVGRNEKENDSLESLAKPDDYLLMTVDIPGPVAVLRGKIKNRELIDIAVGIVSYYSDNHDKEVKICHYRNKKGMKSKRFQDAEPLSEAILNKYKI